MNGITITKTIQNNKEFIEQLGDINENDQLLLLIYSIIIKRKNKDIHYILFTPDASSINGNYECTKIEVFIQ